MSSRVQIQELDAEIKHAFQDLQHKEEQCKELSSRLEGMASEFQDTRKQLDIASGDIQSKHREYQAALSAHQQHMVCSFVADALRLVVCSLLVAAIMAYDSVDRCLYAVHYRIICREK